MSFHVRSFSGSPLLGAWNDAGDGETSPFAMTLEQIEVAISEATAMAEAIQQDAADAGQEPSADDVLEMERLSERVAALKRAANIKRRLSGGAGSRGPLRQGRRTDDGGRIPAQVRDPAEARTHGFGNFGTFASTVGRAYKYRDQSALEQLSNVASTYGVESVGGDGGYLIPPQFAETIWQKVRGEQSLLSRCAPFTTARNSMTFPKDETAPWENSAGIRVFWEGEGDQGTESKPRFELETARLNKLMALIKVTDELIDDAPGLDSYLRFWTPIKMQARINTAIVGGTGVGKPLGILRAPSLITVSKETSQDAATILFPNINNMWSRLYSECRSNAVWLINQQAEPMLNGMAFVPAATMPGGSTTLLTSYTPIYLPSGMVNGSPFGSLFGRPVIPMQPCSALGTLGDIILVDLMQYMALTKSTANGIQVDTSMHLHFDQAIETYRLIFRMTGQPLWNAAISPENGTDTLGWAIVLETRS